MDLELNPCGYVALSDYDWEIIPLLSRRRGACHGISLAWNPAVFALFVALHAVAVWTSLGTLIQAFITFRRWSTVYFWSIILTACSIIGITITTDIILFTSFGDYLVFDSVLYPATDILGGFGFLLVLWSRLHLVIDRPKVLKALLAIIVILCIPLRIVIWLSAIGPPPDRHVPRWGVGVWQVMYRLDMIVPVLDILFACLYIYLFAKRFRSTSSENKAFRRTFWALVAGEIIVIAGDAATMGVWLAGIFLIRWAIGPFIYAVKLLVEFLILNELTSMGKQSGELRHISTAPNDEESALSTQSSLPASTEATSHTTRSSTRLLGDEETSKEGKDLDPTNRMIASTSSSSTTSPLEKIASADMWERKYLGRSAEPRGA